jgi:hypothetical protein
MARISLGVSLEWIFAAAAGSRRCRAAGEDNSFLHAGADEHAIVPNLRSWKRPSTGLQMSPVPPTTMGSVRVLISSSTFDLPGVLSAVM